MSTQITITGNLTHDPELHFLSDGRPVARLSVAVNSRRRDEAGEWTEGDPTFYPQAEHVAESDEPGQEEEAPF